MECQNCHLRPATLHFTKIVNGTKHEYHLCDQCAQNNEEVMVATPGGFSIQQLLSGLLNFEQPIEKERHQTRDTLKCPKCGLTYNEFVKIGKFGCQECYHTFNDRLNPVFRKIHGGNTVHKGKIPYRMGKDINTKRKVQDLKVKLQKLVEEENFEKAAEIRDKIKAMEKGE
ncbi:UvrB/UvrC motif-containing protein [Terrilactibacillus laevilacticus]|uniref:UvrB/UvrC motif-containing protein n=1 Tax=Terrilactibacillus laevilacticus TaxID=1380157 RepID=A0ABW5PR42_9BACI|nr:UvrB/UvrC motif-containing protein [Terrilactibacillus laevilacticus]